MRLLPVLLSLAALIVACTKSESGPPTEGSANATANVPPMASSTAAASGSASAGAGAGAGADASPVATNTAPTGTGTTTNAKEAGATAAAPGGATDGGGAKSAAGGGDGGGATAGGNPSGAGECGTKPLPDCPLQAWMKANMNPPSLSGDTAALAIALEKSASFAPPGYTNWVSISNDGARAAKGGDMAAAKASCRSCHDQYKKKYQAEFRARKI